MTDPPSRAPLPESSVLANREHGRDQALQPVPSNLVTAKAFARTVLVEAFTAVWCIHCPAQSEALYNISLHSSTSVVDVAELHVCAFAPASGPCLENYVPNDNTSDARGSFYHVCGYPDVYFDGQRPACGATNSQSQMEREDRSAIGNASNVPGNVSIAQAARFAPGNVTVRVEIASALSGTFNVVSYLLEYVGKQNVSNGYGPHDVGWVVRETLANHPVDLTAGRTSGVVGQGPLNASWDPSNLSVVSFVQNNATRIVENANLAAVTNQSVPPANVTFLESGLPTGTSWSVTFNGTRVLSAATSIVFPATPGVYNFSVSAAGYLPGLQNFTTSFSGSLVVNSLDETVGVPFSHQRFSLTFLESGLPSGTAWGIAIGSALQTSQTTLVNFTEPNGTYGFVVLALSGWIPTSQGPALVNGSNTQVNVTFRPQTYPVVFIELGLPTGANWSVTVSNASTGFNQTKSSTTDLITFYLPNGTYDVSFSLPPGYTGNFTSSQFTVAGRAESASTINATPPAPAPSGAEPARNGSGPAFPVLWTVLLSVGVGALLVLVAMTFLRRGRSPPPPSSEELDER